MSEQYVKIKMQDYINLLVTVENLKLEAAEVSDTLEKLLQES